MLERHLITDAPESFGAQRVKISLAQAAAIFLFAGLLLTTRSSAAEQNLLKNPGFEEAGSGRDNPANWTITSDSAGKATVTDKEAHAGRYAIAIPAHTSVEQKVGSLQPGAYLARCWVKSESEQPVTFLLRDPDRPWAAYTCAEIKVPRDQWTQIEACCALDLTGSLTLALGGMSQESRPYYGVGGEMGSSIIADDFELIRYQPKPPAGLGPIAVWDVKKELGATLDWSAKEQWSLVETQAYAFAGTPVYPRWASCWVPCARTMAGWLSIRCEQASLSPAALSPPPLPSRRLNAPWCK